MHSPREGYPLSYQTPHAGVKHHILFFFWYWYLKPSVLGYLDMRGAAAAGAKAGAGRRARAGGGAEPSRAWQHAWAGLCGIICDLGLLELDWDTVIDKHETLHADLPCMFSEPATICDFLCMT